MLPPFHALTLSPLLLLCVFAPLREGASGFALPDTFGKEHRLSDYRGRPVVLNFWAFWCDTWKAELPELKQLAGQQHELGFALLAVSVDGTRLQEFERREKALPFPVLLDLGGKVGRVYGVGHVPTVIVLDRDGKARFTHVGFPGNHVLLSEIRKLAHPPAPTGGGAARSPRAP